jgi:hypothetical protein
MKWQHERMDLRMEGGLDSQEGGNRGRSYTGSAIRRREMRGGKDRGLEAALAGYSFGTDDRWVTRDRCV